MGRPVEAAGGGKPLDLLHATGRRSEGDGLQFPAKLLAIPAAMGTSNFWCW